MGKRKGLDTSRRTDFGVHVDNWWRYVFTNTSEMVSHGTLPGHSSTSTLRHSCHALHSGTGQRKWQPLELSLPNTSALWITHSYIQLDFTYPVNALLIFEESKLFLSVFTLFVFIIMWVAHSDSHYNYFCLHFMPHPNCFLLSFLVRA